MRNLTIDVPKKTPAMCLMDHSAPVMIKQLMYFVIQGTISKAEDFEKRVNEILNKADRDTIVVNKLGDIIQDGDKLIKEIVLAEVKFVIEDKKSQIEVPNPNIPFPIK